MNGIPRECSIDCERYTKETGHCSRIARRRWFSIYCAQYRRKRQWPLIGWLAGRSAAQHRPWPRAVGGLTDCRCVHYRYLLLALVGVYLFRFSLRVFPRQTTHLAIAVFARQTTHLDIFKFARHTTHLAIVKFARHSTHLAIVKFARHTTHLAIVKFARQTTHLAIVKFARQTTHLATVMFARLHIWP